MKLKVQLVVCDDDGHEETLVLLQKLRVFSQR
jgi:hypothetical protein